MRIGQPLRRKNLRVRQPAALPIIGAMTKPMRTRDQNRLEEFWIICDRRPVRHPSPQRAEAEQVRLQEQSETPKKFPIIHGVRGMSPMRQREAAVAEAIVKLLAEIDAAKGHTLAPDGIIVQRAEALRAALKDGGS